METLYFDDLRVGARYDLGVVSFTEDEIIAFARAYDPQRVHTDRAHAEGSQFGGIIASGFQTLLVSFRLVHAADIWNAASMGSPGFDELRWLHPVRPGDTLSVRGEVLEVRESGSRDDRGYVKFLYSTVNQDGVTVMTWLANQILARRPPEDGA